MEVSRAVVTQTRKILKEKKMVVRYSFECKLKKFSNVNTLSGAK